MNQRNFDKEAATWDENPARLKVGTDIADALAKAVRWSAEMDIFDFGCGTGQQTLRLAPAVGSVTALDSSEGMLDVLRRKAASLGLANVRAANSATYDWAGNRGRFDAGLCSLALHHIEDVDALLVRFRDLLKPGGSLCLVDLDSDGGEFHTDNTGVFHFGFERAALQRTLTALGFGAIQCGTATSVTKPTAGGALRTFPLFLIVARKG
jgi:ubiquinone/menaquinone biosynthesis C-methylase UbiE